MPDEIKISVPLYDIRAIYDLALKLRRPRIPFGGDIETMRIAADADRDNKLEDLRTILKKYIPDEL